MPRARRSSRARRARRRGLPRREDRVRAHRPRPRGCRGAARVDRSGRVGPRPARPHRLRHARPADVPDGRPQGVARLDDPQGLEGPAGRRRHPHRLRAGLHQGRGHLVRRPRRRRLGRRGPRRARPASRARTTSCTTATSSSSASTCSGFRFVWGRAWRSERSLSRGLTESKDDLGDTPRGHRASPRTSFNPAIARHAQPSSGVRRAAPLAHCQAARSPLTAGRPAALRCPDRPPCAVRS